MKEYGKMMLGVIMIFAIIGIIMVILMPKASASTPNLSMPIKRIVDTNVDSYVTELNDVFKVIRLNHRTNQNEENLNIQLYPFQTLYIDIQAVPQAKQNEFYILFETYFKTHANNATGNGIAKLYALNYNTDEWQELYAMDGNNGYTVYNHVDWYAYRLFRVEIEGYNGLPIQTIESHYMSVQFPNLFINNYYEVEFRIVNKYIPFGYQISTQSAYIKGFNEGKQVVSDIAREEGFYEGFHQGMNSSFDDAFREGYRKGESDAIQAWEGFLPSILGSLAMFFLTIGSISFLGISILEFIAMIAIILIAYLALKVVL